MTSTVEFCNTGWLQRETLPVPELTPMPTPMRNPKHELRGRGSRESGIQRAGAEDRGARRRLGGRGVGGLSFQKLSPWDASSTQLDELNPNLSCIQAMTLPYRDWCKERTWAGTLNLKTKHDEIMNIEIEIRFQNFVWRFNVPAHILSFHQSRCRPCTMTPQL